MPSGLNCTPGSTPDPARGDEPDDATSDAMSWPRVAEILDRLIFTSFSCIIVLLTAATCAYIVAGSNDVIE